jgi:O-antigen ligase
LNLPKQWLESLERTLLTILAGFLFWGNAISLGALFLLVILTFFKKEKKILTLDWHDLYLLFPVLLISALWVLSGFNSTGGKELQLWLIFVAAYINFKGCAFQEWFEKSFIYLSALQVFVVLTFLYGISDSSAIQLSSSQYVRDLIGAEFGVHPTYMGAIWLWGAFLALRRNRPKVIFLFVSSVLIIGSAVAAGKMPFIAFTLVLPGLLFKRIIKKQFKTIVAMFLVGIIAALLFNDSLIRERFNELKTISTTNDYSSWQNATTLRLGIWKCTFSEIKANLWTGVGLGNTRSTLESCFVQYKNEQFFSTEFNSHNQLAHYALTGGIITALLMLIWWFFIGYKCLVNEGLASTTFWFIVFASALMLTENYLLRQHGMMFFSLMLMLRYPTSSFLRKHSQPHTS